MDAVQTVPKATRRMSKRARLWILGLTALVAAILAMLWLSAPPAEGPPLSFLKGVKPHISVEPRSQHEIWRYTLDPSKREELFATAQRELGPLDWRASPRLPIQSRKGRVKSDSIQFMGPLEVGVSRQAVIWLWYEAPDGEQPRLWVDYNPKKHHQSIPAGMWARIKRMLGFP